MVLNICKNIIIINPLTRKYSIVVHFLFLNVFSSEEN